MKTRLEAMLDIVQQDLEDMPEDEIYYDIATILGSVYGNAGVLRGSLLMLKKLVSRVIDDGAPATVHCVAICLMGQAAYFVIYLYI